MGFLDKAKKKAEEEAKKAAEDTKKAGSKVSQEAMKVGQKAKEKCKPKHFNSHFPFFLKKNFSFRFQFKTTYSIKRAFDA